MDANTIREKISNKGYESKMEYPSQSKFKPDHIFDEDKSVKWNKEEVVRQNTLLSEQMAAYRASSQLSAADFDEDVIAYLLDNYALDNNREIASKIASKAFEDGHSGGYNDVLNQAIDLADYTVSIIELLNK